MCDKKNSVLFNDTECVVLSPDFKLSDENHVLLRVPRKNNIAWGSGWQRWITWDVFRIKPPMCFSKDDDVTDGRKLVVNDTVSNNRSGIAVILNVTHGAGYVKHEIVTNPGKASTLAATDAATPILRCIVKAAITYANPITYHSKCLFLSLSSLEESQSKHWCWLSSNVIVIGKRRYTQRFSDLIKSHFEMSMMGEMTFFLGLQVNQSPCGIFKNQSNYVLEILKKYRMESCDLVGTPMEIKDKLDLDQNGTPVDATKYHSRLVP
nr:uncharacterized mitochondrial protein AtMg00810-like [Tanacetum cinerariifolium]